MNVAVSFHPNQDETPITNFGNRPKRRCEESNLSQQQGIVFNIGLLIMPQDMTFSFKQKLLCYHCTTSSYASVGWARTNDTAFNIGMLDGLLHGSHGA